MHFLYSHSLSLRASLSSASGSMPEPSIITFNMDLVYQTIFILLNVVILVAIIAFVLYKPVKKFMDNRSEKIQNDLQTAEEIKAEAQQLKQEYQNQLENINQERKEVLANANKKALERGEHIIKQAREEAESIHRLAMAEIEEERLNMEDEVKRQLIELSVMVAERFVEVSIDQETQNKYIDEAISSWEEGLWLD